MCTRSHTRIFKWCTGICKSAHLRQKIGKLYEWHLFLLSETGSLTTTTTCNICCAITMLFSLFIQTIWNGMNELNIFISHRTATDSAKLVVSKRNSNSQLTKWKNTCGVLGGYIILAESVSVTIPFSKIFPWISGFRNAVSLKQLVRRSLHF